MPQPKPFYTQARHPVMPVSASPFDDFSCRMCRKAGRPDRRPAFAVSHALSAKSFKRNVRLTARLSAGSQRLFQTFGKNTRRRIDLIPVDDERRYEANHIFLNPAGK